MDLELRALEGANPLGFLAALGVMRLVCGRLAFPRGTAVLRTDLDEAGLVARLSSLVQERVGAPELALDVLKHSPAEWGRRLEAAREGASERWFGCYASELVTAGTGDTKPTAFDMTAGQQQFVLRRRELVEALAAAARPPKPKKGVSAEPTLPGELREALFGPWRYRDGEHPLGWDPWAERLYAYQAVAPSDDKRGLSARAALWLAFEALPTFPVFALPSRWRPILATTGFRRSKDDLSFTWPLWTPFAAWGDVRALVSSPELSSDAGWGKLRARGVHTVCQSTRANLGTKGYAILRPPRVFPLG